MSAPPPSRVPVRAAGHASTPPAHAGSIIWPALAWHHRRRRHGRKRHDAAAALQGQEGGGHRRDHRRPVSDPKRGSRTRADRIVRGSP
jgi:hypothetical protein